MNLNFWQIVGVISCILFFLGLGIYSGRKIKNVDDFNVASRSSGTLMLTGAFCGTLIGGSSTIGTAELAFNYGYTAWWFTLGGAVGSIILGVFYAKKLRRGNPTTIQDIIRNEYGEGVAVSTSILTASGMTINIVSQTLATNLLISSMFGFSPLVCTIISLSIMLCYVLFGGIRGAGILGTAKLILLCIGTIVCGIMVNVFVGGFSGFEAGLPETYSYMFNRGFQTDLCAGLSVVFGTISTQTYIQTLFTGKSDKVAILGSVLSGIIIIPVGLLCIHVGMYMKMMHPEIAPGQAFPLFIVDYLPGVFSGIILVALIITVVGTASGMALGFSTVLSNDIYKRFINKNATSKQMLICTRTLIVLVIVCGAFYAMTKTGTAVIHYGVISFGLRAVVACLPLTTAIFIPGRIDKRFVLIAEFTGIVSLIVAELYGNSILDPLILGMLVCAFFMGIGFIVNEKRRKDV